MTKTSNIPQPKTYGPLGNLPQINLDAPLQSIMKIADELGPIFRMDLPGRSDLYISGHELVKDACDESRFDKNVWAPLQKVRAFGGDGLFTSWTEEENWHKAHNILLPSFSQRAMQGYHCMMVDLAVQLVQKWSRLNSDESVQVPEDMTRLTLDTIGLCGFNYRFNSFYREQPHPFIISMTRALDEAMSQLQRLGLKDKLMVITKRQFNHDIQTMFALVDKIIADRKEHGSQGEEDLLAHMLSGKDPETGESLDDENIRYQIITFLIAGHETTSGLLSFALYYLLKNPDKLQKAYEEVDQVMKDPIPTYKQVRELKYIRMILNESLRLWPTAPAFSLFAKEDTMLAGEFPVQKGGSVNVLIPTLHRDRDAWGDDAEAFKPERFEDPSAIPHHAYKPFGNGQRACIGQQFALQEAALVLGMVLKHFEIIDHSNYQLKVKETLTLKPDGFTIQVKSRGHQAAATLSAEEKRIVEEKIKKPAFAPGVEAHNTPLLVLYGSNLGTAEGIARELADTARFQGFNSEVAPLDAYVGKLPKEGAVFIVTASYNGKPPGNASAFVEWLDKLEPGELTGVRYTVFGCGDHNWASTYQEIPKFIDRQLTAKGAERLSPPGEGDASGDFEKELEVWRERMWPDVMNFLNLKFSEQAAQDRSSLSVQFVSGLVDNPLAENYDAFLCGVKENRELTPRSERSTRHIVVSLPEGISYKEGDHLGVLPQNNQMLVDRVLRRFKLDGNDHLIIHATGRSAAHLPLGKPVSLADLLSHSVELQEPATRAQLRELAKSTVCPPHRQELESLLQEDTYKTEVLQKRVSMLDLLEKYEACEIAFELYLELLPPLKPRYYSISSSPRQHADHASITVRVVKSPAWNGRGEYRGVASNYLAECGTGVSIATFIRTPETGFQLPDQPETPIIMVGPGTGVAPFLGFLQARKVWKEEGKRLGEAHLYFGCRNPDEDFLYQDELEAYQQDGLLTLYTAFSRSGENPKTYVQDLMLQNAKEWIRLLDQGGKLYICGDGSRMTPAVEHVLWSAYGDAHGITEEESRAWLAQLERNQRYVKDVWSGL
ncbi:bifunctional cytochrome P450/NADPH--P450 reductase [Paenibacillus eucommiae]|uniref:Bifunctional cytochrome P450/NADPH--P450 reductase n=1 Tax=Paenibacillus eucommiae TaxID=1355755 RepID=A0ABS4IQV7_9BACL|nr:bifunctional cytochrome P450/NADPH--P450 reductase [Paenibacillus eucommiae]MBP1989915.1 cytochrome P450/NADPH-cytochrome P450 reductase [Paenibacillus eucommiae]